MIMDGYEDIHKEYEESRENVGSENRKREVPENSDIADVIREKFGKMEKWRQNALQELSE